MIVPNGRKISFVRIKAGLSMRELGRIANVNMSVISQAESRNKPVAPKTAKSICDALGKDFGELFTIKTREEIV